MGFLSWKGIQQQFVAWLYVKKFEEKTAKTILIFGIQALFITNSTCHFCITKNLSIFGYFCTT